MHFEFNPDTCVTWLELKKQTKKKSMAFPENRGTVLRLVTEKSMFVEGGRGRCEEAEGCNSLTRDVSLENNILLILPSYRVLTAAQETCAQSLVWGDPQERA